MSKTNKMLGDTFFMTTPLNLRDLQNKPQLWHLPMDSQRAPAQSMMTAARDFVGCSRSFHFERCPILPKIINFWCTGIGPLNELRRNWRCRKSFKYPNEIGRLPASWLYPRSSVFNLLLGHPAKPLMNLFTSPVILLKESINICKLHSFASVFGSPP